MEHPRAASTSSSGRTASSSRSSPPRPPRPRRSTPSRTGEGDGSVHALIQGVILGILTGGVYALMASGQTLIFGIMKVVNLAQGAMVIMAAYLSYQLFTMFGMDPFLAIPITTILMFGLGVGVELLFLRPLRREDKSELSLLVTFAVALLIEGVLSVTWGTTYRSINTSYANSSWTLWGYQITVVRFWAFVLSLVALGLLFWLLNRTRFGRAVRATVQNPESARLLGVEAQWVSALGFGLGAATAAAAGSVYGLLYPCLLIHISEPTRLGMISYA